MNKKTLSIKNEKKWSHARNSIEEFHEQKAEFKWQLWLHVLVIKIMLTK